MIDNIGKVFLKDGKLYNSRGLTNESIEGKDSVYEVIRIIEGVPLFIEDHYSRLKNSLCMLGKQVNFTEENIRNDLKLIAKENKQDLCNVKIVVYGKEELRYILYVSESYYPDQQEILRGANLGLLQLERVSPNLKILNKQYKEIVKKYIIDNNVFEVLLVNNEGEITEGSRSNVFFLKDGVVYTSPKESVLEGITRKYVIKTCEDLGRKVIEKNMTVAQLEKIDAVFLSGTSIKVLPVHSINGYIYDSSKNLIIKEILEEFDTIINRYISKNV